MSETIDLASQSQIETIYRLSLKLRADDADELHRQLASMQDPTKNKQISFGRAGLATPLLPVDGLQKFYLLHRSLTAFTVTRERDRLDIAPGYEEQTWMELDVGPGGTVLANNFSRVRAPKTVDSNSQFIDSENLTSYTDFLRQSQLEVVTAPLCEELIRQLGGTAVCR